jgi:hypothetical protein
LVAAGVHVVPVGCRRQEGGREGAGTGSGGSPSRRSPRAEDPGRSGPLAAVGRSDRTAADQKTVRPSTKRSPAWTCHLDGRHRGWAVARHGERTSNGHVVTQDLDTLPTALERRLAVEPDKIDPSGRIAHTTRSPPERRPAIGPDGTGRPSWQRRY